MITLGINAAYHDSSACLVRDGIVVAAAEEERFTRIKHGKRPVPFSAWELPWHAIEYCLRQAQAHLADVDHVAYAYDPRRLLGQREIGDTIALPLEPSAATPAERDANPWDPLFASYLLNAPRQLASGAPHHLRDRLRGVRHDGPYRWHFVEHHTAHEASAYLASPFERCAVLTMDGRGEDVTTSYGRYRDGRYQRLGEVRLPHSLGLLYETITRHLGFLHSSDEYKVMAMAAFGQPRMLEQFDRVVRVGDDGRYRIDAFDPADLFGPARERGQPIDARHLDLAASLQALLERTVLRLGRWLREASGEQLLAMAGGVALNCVMNARLRDAGIFDGVWVQPAAGDAGTALGAALRIDADERGHSARRWTMRDAYLGPEYDDDEIESLLRWAKLRYRRMDDVAAETAEVLAGGAVVGWFQGRMEFGPRALGARSILASPTDPSMQARLNELKDREDFRPVAPAILRESLGDWFSPSTGRAADAPFMLFVYDVLPGRAERIPAVCHVDGTARVQTVDAAANPRFHALLHAFERRTDVPILVNTSFNVRGEPIVCTPKDAIDAFFSTPLDALAIGSFLLRKGSQR